MRTLSICTYVASLFVVVVACQPRNQDTMPPNGAPPAAYTSYPPAQPPQGYPAQGPAGTYPGAAIPPAPSVPMPAPSGSGPMAVPGPIAFQCKDDVPCGTHHCNLQYGKCAFPCQSVADCLQPNSCMAGFCVPMLPPSH
jgi:hypothetical protein